MRTNLPAQPNLSLIDGLSCLQALAAHREPIGTRELAKLLELETTRVNRLLKTLAHLGLAEQDDRRRYRPGPAIHVLAASTLYGSGLLRSAIAPLESLLPHGHIVAMGVLWQDRTCYLVHLNPSEPKSLSAHGLGHSEVFPATSSGIGMALLAHEPIERIHELYGPGRLHEWPPPLEPLPELEGAGGLLAELGRIRRQGHALVSIPQVGKRTLAVPVGTRPYASIALSGQFTDANVPDLLPELVRVAEEIDLNSKGTKPA